jgi:hypothetical protein
MVKQTPSADMQVILDFTGEDVFVMANGLRIAKRGHPDTHQAGTWISLEPGWTVVSSSDLRELMITKDGARVH